MNFPQGKSRRDKPSCFFNGPLKKTTFKKYINNSIRNEMAARLSVHLHNKGNKFIVFFYRMKQRINIIKIKIAKFPNCHPVRIFQVSM